MKINGCPIELVEPDLLRYKVFEPILLLGRERFSIMDLRIRVKGGGYTSQIYGGCCQLFPFSTAQQQQQQHPAGCVRPSGCYS